MSDDRDERLRQRALADTVPGAKLRRPDPSDDVVTSAPAASVAGALQAAGSVTLDEQRLTEAAARAIVDRRLGEAGFHIQSDYAYHFGELSLTLDGFDPERRVGYQFLSHADADVVTDFDDAAAERIAALAAQGTAHILVVHDHEAPTAADLTALVDAFLARCAP